jgi:intein/homing endonuclease
VKFYVTIEGTPRLKKSFLNLKLFSIIYIPEILEKYGYTYSTIDEYGSFIISTYIDDLIRTYAKSKRIRGIIYSNPSLTEEILPNLFDTLENIETISEVVLLDDYNVPKLTYIYSYFDEIVFFPLVKKIRLIECQKINNIENIRWKT